MAPQYFFYNLPPSESKDILQHILDSAGSTHHSDKKQKTQTRESEPHKDCAENQSYERCVVQ